MFRNKFMLFLDGCLWKFATWLERFLPWRATQAIRHSLWNVCHGLSMRWRWMRDPVFRALWRRHRRIRRALELNPPRFAA